MLPLQFADLEMGLRAVLAVDDQVQEAQARCLVSEAHESHVHRAATGRPHPAYGNGTLYAAALASGAVARPAALGPAELRALQRLIAALLSAAEHQTA
ncbi:MAG: hypothetical protein AAFU41_05435 [Pseudomonadota bacterium]